MATFKKLFVSLLTSLMLVSCVGFNIFAEGEIQQSPMQSEEGPLIALGSEIPGLEAIGPFASIGPLQGTEGIDVPEEYATKIANIATNFAWAFSGGGNFLMGACISGGVVGIFDVVTSILKEVIVFGPSKEDIQFEQMMNKLNSIEGSIEEVSKKVDAIQDTLNVAIKKIDEGLSDISVKLDNQNIANVADIAEYITSKMNSFEADLNGELHRWYDNAHYEDFISGSNFIINAPYSTGTNTQNGIDNIKINGITMKDAVTYYIDNGGSAWNSDDKDDIIKAIFGSIFDGLDKTNSELTTWLTHAYGSDYASLSEENKTKAKNAFAEAAYQSLCMVAAENIAKSNTSHVNAADLVDKFNLYCKYLMEEGGRTSPFTSQYNIYSTLYAFQGDLNRSISYKTVERQGTEVHEITKTDNTNLLDLSRQKYISELNKLGTFVGLIAKASKNYGEKTDMVNLIYLPWAKAEKYTNDKYAEVYKVDNYNNPIDNYCYVTGTKLEYESGDLTANLVMNFYAWENGFGTDIKSYRKSYMQDDFTYSIYGKDISNMVNSTDMSLIYAHYMSSTGGSNLRQHLIDMGVIKDFHARMTPNEIITNFLGPSGFSGTDKVSMFIKNCHNNPDKWSGKDFTKGDVTTVTSSSSHFVVRRKASADTFDLTNGTLTNAKRIGAVASFYEKYTFKDDLVVFWDAEYNNPTTVDERKSLAALDNFYWRQRYDKASDDEERYNSFVEYRRRWGTLLSVPVGGGLEVRDVRSHGNNGEVVLNSKYNAFEDELKAKGQVVGSFDDYKFDDTYRIYFNSKQYSGEVTESIYNKLVDYLSTTKLQEMVDDYYDYYDEAKAVIDSIDDKTYIDLDNDELSRLVTTLIEEDGNCKIVNSVPQTKDSDNIYDWSTGKFYVWNGSQYIEYKEKAKPEKGEYINKQATIESLQTRFNFDIVNTLPSEEIVGKNVYLSTRDEFYVWSGNEYILDENYGKANALLKLAGYDFPNEIDDDSTREDVFLNYPYTSSTDYKFKYEIKPVIAYELYFINNTDIAYKIHMLYEIKPILIFKNSGVEEKIVVSDTVLENAHIGTIDVIIPILDLDDNDNRASVYHFANLEQVEYPLESLTGKIKSNDVGYYTTIEVNTFSPFAVVDTYHKSSDKKYTLPVTGIN